MTANPLGSGVTLRSVLDPVRVTCYCASGITAADRGKLVKVGAADNTVALCADGDDIFGILEIVEDDTVQGVVVGTVLISGGAITLTYDAEDTVALGEKIVAGADTAAVTVKRVASPTVFNGTRVVAKNATAGTVDIILNNA